MDFKRISKKMLKVKWFPITSDERIEGISYINLYRNIHFSLLNFDLNNFISIYKSTNIFKQKKSFSTNNQIRKRPILKLSLRPKRENTSSKKTPDIKFAH